MQRTLTPSTQGEFPPHRFGLVYSGTLTVAIALAQNARPRSRREALTVISVLINKTVCTLTQVSVRILSADQVNSLSHVRQTQQKGNLQRATNLRPETHFEIVDRISPKDTRTGFRDERRNEARGAQSLPRKLLLVIPGTPLNHYHSTLFGCLQISEESRAGRKPFTPGSPEPRGNVTLSRHSC